VSEPYVGEIRMFAGTFAPVGWAFCDGQILPISENETLFNLIGTTYGGDGQSTFGLPDLRGRLPIHQGNGFVPAESGGAEDVTLTANQIPAHTHPLLASTALATQETPGASVTGQTEVALYGTQAPLGPMNPSVISPTGGSQPHSNFQPYLCVNFIISLFGVYPSPS
jgi:microcystin-dependent protein